MRRLGQIGFILATCTAAIAARAEEASATSAAPADTAAETAPVYSQADAVRGTDGWIFWKERQLAYSKEDDLPVKNAEVILDFATQLKSVGITLYLVPVPDQAYLAREHWPDPKATFTRAHFEKAYEWLRSKGVTVVDSDTLLEKLRDKGEKVALTQDTHLTPLAYETLAAETAALIQKQIKIQGRPKDFVVSPLVSLEPAWTANTMHMKSMDVPMKANRVLHVRDKLNTERPGQVVMIMGDSHTTEFAEQNASFIDHLAYDLGIVPDVRKRMGDAAALTIRGDLARQHDNLEGTQAVVWIFWEAALVLNNRWKKVPVIELPQKN